MQQTQVRFLGWGDLLEKGMTTHSSILACRIPKIEEPGGYSPWGLKELDITEPQHFHFKTCGKVWKTFPSLMDSGQAFLSVMS